MVFGRVRERSVAAAVAALCLAAALGGCSDKPDRAELDLLTNDDPVFHELIRSKTVLDTQIAQIRKALVDRKRDMDQKIQTMRQTYDADRRSKEQAINEYQALIKTQKDDFEASYVKVKAQLEARQKMRSDIEKAILEARGVVAKKDKLAITGKEIGEWEARIENLENRLGPLDEEISALESLASLKRKKLKYL